MLQSTYELDYPAKKGQYKLDLPIDNHWDRANQRVLLILETVDSQDLRSGRLLSSRSRTVVENLLSYCHKQVKKHGHPRGQAYAALNFNNVKFLDQAKELWPSYRASFAKRVQAAVKQLDPTNVVIFGDRAAKALMPHIENLEKKRGWVLDEVLGGKKRKVTVSLDLENLYNASRDSQDEDDDDSDGDEGDRDTFGKANLLFYVTRNVVNNLCDRHLFDLSHIQPHYTYVDTISKFKELYSKLIEAQYVAVDTETANLTSTCNAIGTMQFAFSTKRGYVLPIDHEQSPFNAEERNFIKKKLRKFFFAKPGVLPLKYLITQYGMFDLRVVREELCMPLIFHPVWEITAAEWCFHPDTLVETEHGKLSILEVVQRPGTKVWSYNHKTGARELKEVLGGSHTPSSKPMLEITYEGGTIRVTEDHKVWSNTRSCYVEAKDTLLNEDVELFLA